MPFRDEARLGTTLPGGYRLERVMGHDAVATTYGGIGPNGVHCAIKVMHVELSREDDLRARFFAEAEIARRIHHDGVRHVRDGGVTVDGAAFIVMELLFGESLRAHLQQRGPLSLREVVATGVRVLDVLEAAHARGILHRHLAPAKLFRQHDGLVKILDFGATHASIGLTQHHVVRSCGFVSPEQALGKSPDERTDLWCLGATLFTLASGRTVHAGESSEELAVRAAIAPAPPLGSVLAKIPFAIASVIDRALAYDRRARWSSAREMKGAFESAGVA